MNPFESAGEKARWRILYDKLVTMKPGDMISYEVMGSLLDLDPRDDRHLIQTALYRAAKELLEIDSRAVDVVRGQGYEIVETRDHLRLAKIRGQRAGHQIGMAVSLVLHADLTEVQDPEVRKGFEVMAAGFAQQDEINRRQRRTNDAMMKAIEAASSTQERTAEEVAEFQRRLAELEAKLS